MAKGLLALMVVVGSIAAARAPENPVHRTAVVERRDFAGTIRIHGVVEAVSSYAVSAPRLAGPGLSSLLITKLARSGSMVRRGAVLIEFDIQNQIKIVRDREAEYRDLLEQIKRKEAEHAATQARDQTDLRQAENNVRAARLELRKNEVLSRIDAEKNQRNLEEAEAYLQHLRDTLKVKHAAAAAELRILEIQRDRAAASRRYAQRNVESMSVRSPMDGLVVLLGTWKGDRRVEPAKGDEVRPGIPLLQILDPAALQVRARVNQVDIDFLRPGQPTRVQLDAYPGLSLPGRVEQIAPIASTSSFSQKLRTFNTVFSIDGTHAKLLPDLSAALDVEIVHRRAALVVPRDALVLEEGKTYMYAQTPEGVERRLVKVGPKNAMEVVIESGVRVGEVVLRNPELETR